MACECLGAPVSACERWTSLVSACELWTIRRVPVSARQRLGAPVSLSTCEALVGGRERLSSEAVNATFFLGAASCLSCTSPVVCDSGDDDASGVLPGYGWLTT